MKVGILGATNNSSRYAYRVAEMLTDRDYEIFPVGIKRASVKGKEIIRSKEPIEELDVITLYVGPQNQAEWYDFIINSKPQRLIFNPGTENRELYKKASDAGIECVNACTLVMLASGTFEPINQ